MFLDNLSIARRLPLVLAAMLALSLLTSLFGHHDGRDQRELAAHRRHHRRDRRHRVPDPHPRAQRRGGGCARRRAGPRLRGGGDGGAQPRAAQRGVGARDQGADRHERRQGGGGAWLVEQAGTTMDEIVAGVQPWAT
jgi:hypothetical protein